MGTTKLIMPQVILQLQLTLTVSEKALIKGD